MNAAEPEDAWRDRISKENEERVAAMDDAEREEEIRLILERFGSNIGDVLKQAKLTRKQQIQSGEPSDPLCFTQGIHSPQIWWTRYSKMLR